eukprot:652050-Prorocentrum_minimum.AAC.1
MSRGWGNPSSRSGGLEYKWSWRSDTGSAGPVITSVRPAHGNVLVAHLAQCGEPARGHGGAEGTDFRRAYAMQSVPIGVVRDSTHVGLIPKQLLACSACNE